VTTFEWFVLIWLIALGGCIGSFMNVVIYRLPRGGTLGGRSKCPRCGHQIRAYHNLPVLGWLALRGRCYDCRQRISARYPLVEATVAAVFAVLYFLIFRAGGRSAADTLLQITRWCLYGSLAAFSCSLICVMLTRYDHARVTSGLMAFLAISLVASAAFSLAL
jgi:prepilin signal peptidase PulO-like enzyme (type II secretory pathway)